MILNTYFRNCLHQKKRGFISKRNGVTLIEILISLTILIIVVTAISTGTNDLTRRLIATRNNTTARNLAWKKLAETKSSIISVGHSTGVFGKDYPGYRYSQKISHALVHSRGYSGLYEYEILIKWREGLLNQSLNLKTFIYQRPQQEDSD